MEISITVQKKILIVTLTGELDHHSAKEVKELIEEVIKNQSINHLIFDFSRLTFMDSSGIGVIIGRYKLVSSLGGKLAIAGAKKSVEKLLHMSGINKIIDMFDTKDAAQKSLEEVIL